MKQKTRDVYYSNLVRERAEWACEVCHKYFPPGDRSDLHCSHHISRARRLIRWHPQNAAAHCRPCHSVLGLNPLKHADWVRNHIGQEVYDFINELSTQNASFKKHELDEIGEHLKAEWKIMQDKRKEGITGRIEFRGPAICLIKAGMEEAA